MIRHGATATLVFVFAGLIIWAARFVAIYSFTALACAKQFAGLTLAGIGIVSLFVGAATLLAIAANAWVVMLAIGEVRRYPGSVDDVELAPFVGYTAATVAGLSIIAILWETLPVLIVPVCN